MKFLCIFLFHTRLIQSVMFTKGRRIPLAKKKKTNLHCFLQCMCSSNKIVGQKQIMPVTVRERANRLRQTNMSLMNIEVGVVTHCRRWAPQHCGIPLLLRKTINSWFPFFLTFNISLYAFPWRVHFSYH